MNQHGFLLAPRFGERFIEVPKTVHTQKYFAVRGLLWAIGRRAQPRIPN